MIKKEFLVFIRGNIIDRNDEFLVINELVFGVFLFSGLK